MNQHHHEEQFIEELQEILRHEPGTRLQVDKEATFKEIYVQLQPTFQELQQKYELHENPVGTNTEVVLFHSKLFSTWYDMEIFSKPKRNPNKILFDGMEKLFQDNNKYTYPNGKTIYYYKGRNQIPRIKRDILQEFDLLNNTPQMFKVNHLLKKIKPRFT